MDSNLPTEEDCKLAESALRALEDSQIGDKFAPVEITSASVAAAVNLPALVTELLIKILRETAAGRPVKVSTVEMEARPREADESPEADLTRRETALNEILEFDQEFDLI